MAQSMKTPVTYQGGKSRLAEAIAARLNATNAPSYYDLCCGSGAVTLALLARGIEPDRIHMCDLGPWGLVWKTVGQGTFDTEALRNLLSGFPDNPDRTHAHVTALAADAVGEDAPYVFLALQAAAFGGKAVHIKDGRWCDCNGRKLSFRRYWLPTATSNRRSPVNPMMPMPATIQRRMEILVPACVGLRCHHGTITDLSLAPGSTVYIDPPYEETTGYGPMAPWRDLLGAPGIKFFVSEAKRMSLHAALLAKGRRKGGISGNRSIANEEWLNESPFYKDVAGAQQQRLDR